MCLYSFIFIFKLYASELSDTFFIFLLNVFGMADIVLFLFAYFFVFAKSEKLYELCNGTVGNVCPLFGVNVSGLCVGYNDRTLTVTEKNYIVRLHNTLRNNITSGINKKLPKGSSMKKISWNSQLTEMARSWSTQCKSEVDPICKAENAVVGQNIAIKELLPDQSVNIKVLINQWIDEINFLNFEIINKFRKPTSEERDFTSATQMLWWNTSEIGCWRCSYNATNCSESEKVTCDDNKILLVLVCNYFPAGNKVGAAIYETDLNETVGLRFLKNVNMGEVTHYISATETSTYVKDGSKKPDYRTRTRMIDLWPSNVSSCSLVTKHFSVLTPLTLSFTFLVNLDIIYPMNSLYGYKSLFVKY